MLFATSSLILSSIVLALLGWVIRASYERHVALQKIEKLGGRAAVIPTRWPLGKSDVSAISLVQSLIVQDWTSSTVWFKQTNNIVFWSSGMDSSRKLVAPTMIPGQLRVCR